MAEIKHAEVERAAYRLACPPNTFNPGEELSELLKSVGISLTPGAEPSPLPKELAESADRLARHIQAQWASILTVKREVTEYVGRIDKAIKHLDKMLRDEHRAPSIEEIRARQALLEKREQLERDFLQKSGQDRDFYYAVHAEGLTSLGGQLREGRIAQTPYVSKMIADIVRYLERGETVFLYGHTGGGKTETARIAAKEFSGKDPVVVRGYPGMAQEELFGHLTLKADGLKRASDVVKSIEAEVLNWQCDNIGADETATKEATKLITQRVLSENRATVVEYVLGAQYLAMKEGRVIIYDEANAIPAALRRKLNDLKTKRVGETVSVQEDGGLEFKVAQGYGEIETANIGQRYGEGGGGRFAFSPDEHDRRQAYLEYGYLPQAVKGSFQDVSDPKHKQLYMIALAAVMDLNGNIVAPKDSLEKLWTLAQYAALTQQAFSGSISPDNQFVQGGTKVAVQTSVLISPRGLQSILNAWRSEGYQHELDHYVASNILNRATDPTERAYLYQLGQACGLFRGEGWVDCPNFPAGKVSGFSVEVPENRAAPIDVIPVTEVIEAVWGPAPARSEWSPGAGNREIPEEERIAAMQAMEVTLADMEALINALKDDQNPDSDKGDPPQELGPDSPPAPKSVTGVFRRLLGRRSPPAPKPELVESR